MFRENKSQASLITSFIALAHGATDKETLNWNVMETDSLCQKSTKETRPPETVIYNRHKKSTTDG